MAVVMLRSSVVGWPDIGLQMVNRAATYRVEWIFAEVFQNRVKCRMVAAAEFTCYDLHGQMPLSFYQTHQRRLVPNQNRFKGRVHFVNGFHPQIRPVRYKPDFPARRFNQYFAWGHRFFAMGRFRFLGCSLTLYR